VWPPAASSFEKAGFLIQFKRILAKEKLIFCKMLEFDLPNLRHDFPTKRTARPIPASGVCDD